MAYQFFRSETIFQANGVMAKGFKKLNNVTYYFYKGSGVMATGWVNNTSKGYQVLL